jgi:CRP/FNR family transcriptional regulator, cyclic AMP receptor protein
MAESGGILGVFQSHAFLANLSRQHLMILASGVRPFAVKPGEFLAREGDSANAFYLIQSGHVEVATRRTVHEPVTIQTIGPGEVIGWSWIVPGQQWKFDCRAADDVSGLAFDANWLRERCEQDHELGYHLLKQLLTVIANRLAATRGGGRDVKKSEHI